MDCSLSKEEKEQLIEHLDIKNFRNNPAVNVEIGFMNKTGNFIHKGKAGVLNEEFEHFPEMEKQFDAWLSFNKVMWSSRTSVEKIKSIWIAV